MANPYISDYGLLFFPDSGEPDFIPIYATSGDHIGEYLQHYETFQRPSYSWSDSYPQRDWMLYPVGRQEVDPPDVEIVLLDIPGSDVPLDMTETLIGRPIYKTREADWDFKAVVPRNEWDATYSEIMNLLHGQRFIIIRMEDPAWFYRGRIKVTSTDSDKYNGRVKLHATLEPFKYAVQKSDEDWLWDPFSFEDGIIWNCFNDYSESCDIPESFGYLVVSQDLPRTVTLGMLSEAPTVPTFTGKFQSGIELKAVYGGEDYPMTANIPLTIPGLEFSARDPKQIRFEATGDGSAYVSISFRRTSF